MGFGGDAGGLPHALQLFGSLAQALGVQQWTGSHQTKSRRSTAGSPIKLLAPGLEHQGLHLGMAPHPKGNALSSLEVVTQAIGEFREGMGKIGAKVGDRPLRAPAEAIPDFCSGLLGLHKQHKAGVIAVGQQQGHRTRFVKACEIPKIAVLAEGVFTIGVMHHHRRRRNHRRHSTELLKKTGPALGKDRHQRAAWSATVARQFDRAPPTAVGRAD